MGMILLLLAVLMLGSWWMRRHEQRPAGVKPPTERKALPPPEKMVRCVECGTYLPLSDARQIGEAHFCSASHQHAFEARQR